VRLEARLLDLPAPRGARATVSALVHEAEQELVRLETGSDGEALHDFRVALRRLRSVARALEPHLGRAFRRKLRRQLRDVAGATNAARDAEVQVAWMAAERAGAGPRELPGIEWLAGRLEERRAKAYGHQMHGPAARFRGLARKLERALAEPEELAPAARAPPFGVVLADLVRSHAADLFRSLGTVGGPLDVGNAHAARIAGKRLRYLLEPLRGNRRADARPAVTVLKELQDLLGDLHDAHVAMDTVAEALVESAAVRAREAHSAVLAGRAGAEVLRLVRRDRLARGLLWLDGRAVERATALHGRLAAEWTPARRGRLVEPVAAVAEGLARPAPRPVRPGTLRRRPARRRARGGAP
jgi:CHAD domain-containing protein